MKKTTKGTGRQAARGGPKKPAAAGSKRPAKPAGARAAGRTGGAAAGPGRPAARKAKPARPVKVKPQARPDSAGERDRKREATKLALRTRVRAAGATTLATTAVAATAPARLAAPAPPAAREKAGAKLPDTPAAALARRMWKVLDDMQAIEPVIISVGDRTPMAEYFLVASGKSTTHTRALFNALYRAMKDAHIHLLHSEGQNAALWILADYGSVVAHLFEQETRSRYALEELWQATREMREEDLL